MSKRKAETLNNLFTPNAKRMKPFTPSNEVVSKREELATLEEKERTEHYKIMHMERAENNLHSKTTEITELEEKLKNLNDELTRTRHNLENFRQYKTLKQNNALNQTFQNDTALHSAYKLQLEKEIVNVKKIIDQKNYDLTLIQDAYDELF